MNRHCRSSMVLRLGMIAFSGLPLLSTANAHARSYQLNPKAKNRVEFHSKATLESFSGKAKSITAEFDVEPENLAATRGKVTVDLRSLDTGIDMRNKHMRENHLHTDSFPSAIFNVDSLRMLSSPRTGTDSVAVYGVMTIRGVSQATAARGVVTTQPGSGEGARRFEAEFPLKITDFGIPRPEFLFLKLAEEVKIVVDLTLSPTAE